ncbi:hypothetical protein JD844_002719 [Phrynosoma platyrhinos]|uniref:Prolactin-releasing peptide n=1 Tax=Phrynosoma platyrhinos TaxID=52577 RepID=A0ABQ7TBW6_PHRPL|nr:hypothetical protein JD844_002719 [Phrynosoma platyrhinos]
MLLVQRGNHLDEMNGQVRQKGYRTIKSLVMVILITFEQPLRKQLWLIMLASALKFHPHQQSPRPKASKLITVYILVLLLSASFTSGQRRVFTHQIDNRSPEIDPFWYVGRGVRPIGRFGKRQLKFGQNIQRSGNSILDLLLTALQDQEALKAEDDGW